MTKELTLKDLKDAVASYAAAFRCVTKYQPAGGPGDKVFPPTYEGGSYAVEVRMIDGQSVDCVLLDSVQSQANRMELALLEAWRTKDPKGERLISIPVLVANFGHESLLKKFAVTSLEAPHRAADAIFRDSTLEEEVNGERKKINFRSSTKGKLLDTADVRNATGLFGFCPTALLFGLWDSTGPRGGLGAKFQRALVSEMIGINVAAGVRPSSRIDPLGVERRSGPVFRTVDGNWTLDPDKAQKVKGKPALFGLTNKGELVPYDPNKDQEQGRPSKINHGNVTPSLIDPKTNRNLPGGFTVGEAVQTTVLSLAAIRRLRFPLNGAVDSDPVIDNAARTALTALGLAAATMARTDGDLRSRCQLFPLQQPSWELLDVPGKTPEQFSLTPAQAAELLNGAVKEVKNAGLPWEDEIQVTPSDELVKLVRRSQELASTEATEGE